MKLKGICLFHQHHEKECLYLPVTCSVCGKKGIQQSLLSQHLDPNTGDCDGSKAVCPFLALGCPEREVRFSKCQSFFQDLIAREKDVKLFPVTKSPTSTDSGLTHYKTYRVNPGLALIGL